MLRKKLPKLGLLNTTIFFKSTKPIIELKKEIGKNPEFSEKKEKENQKKNDVYYARFGYPPYPIVKVDGDKVTKVEESFVKKFLKMNK